MSNQRGAYYQTRHWRELLAAAHRRDGDRCATPGCPRRGCVVDHIKTRPPVPYPTALDVLDNLRTLCRSCDARVKELPGGRGRRSGGQLKARGCDVDGWPLDPKRRK